MTTTWSDNGPKTCQDCGCNCEGRFVDGPSTIKPAYWAILCEKCHGGRKLGIGHGQLYEARGEEWVCIDGEQYLEEDLPDGMGSFESFLV